jgi:hypothetical protein
MDIKISREIIMQIDRPVLARVTHLVMPLIDAFTVDTTPPPLPSSLSSKKKSKAHSPSSSSKDAKEKAESLSSKDAKEKAEEAKEDLKEVSKEPSKKPRKVSKDGKGKEKENKKSPLDEELVRFLFEAFTLTLTVSNP